MTITLYALSTVVAVWFVATSLVAVRRSLMGRDLEQHLAAVGDDVAGPGRARVERPAVAVAA